ncbi:MAG: L,D-transpeptidase family protein [Chloroflexi bacterium]|nr:L,D-transpeptidase family protein [Chloroflexota bacterium]
MLTIWFAATHLLAGHIFPNVWALGTSIGNMPIEEAQAKLLEIWENQVQIQLVNGDRVWTASPTELGLHLDAKATAEQARSIGMAGIPLGYTIEPVVNANAAEAQAYLMSLTTQVDIAPVNASFELRDDQLIGVPGQAGRALDIDRTLANLTKSPGDVGSRQRLELVTSSVPSEAADPTPYLEAARQLTNQPFAFTGYDPFRDESITWTTTRAVSASWLEVRRSGLNLREATFSRFIEAQNATLHAAEADRYLDPIETAKAMNQAIVDQRNAVALRIRYHPTTYTVAAGDTGYRIARKTGIPFYLIQEANPGFDLSVLSPGDSLKLPSRDVTVPLPPLNNKRIVVNLDTQNLIAYENGQQVFSWPISSGIEQAPTSPGVFQILSHEPVAYGSSYTLCGDTGCGQWQMQWFMGIYEVTPGLVNGFHGAVLLPNGAYLGGGNVGSPYTLGCIMSQNDNAQKLYEWADEGTIVEIISSEFPPQSDLARLQAGQL